MHHNRITLQIDAEQAWGGLLREEDMRNLRAHLTELLGGRHNVKAVSILLTVTEIDTGVETGRSR